MTMKELLFLLLITAWSAIAAGPVQDMIAREDWQGLAGLTARPASMDPAVHAYLKAHALLALNRSNESTCQFAALTSASDLSAWEAWTREFLAGRSDRAVAHYLRGDALARLQNWQDALKEFDKALVLNPKHFLSLNARGVVLVINGKFNNALADFVTAEASGPQFADARINRGYLGILRKYSAAALLKQFDAALTLSPGASLAVVGRARALVARGESISGLAEFDRSPGPCAFVDEIMTRDRAALFAWVRDQESTLLAEARSPDAGTTLTNLLKDVGEKRNVESVKKAIDFAAKSNDVELQKRAANTLKSYERLDKNLAPTIGKAVAELEIENQMRHDKLLKRSEVKPSVEAELALQVKDRGVNIGGGVSAKLEGDLKAYAEEQIKKVTKERDFTKQLSDQLTVTKEQAGGAETMQIRLAPVDRGNAPAVFHNGLLYTSADWPLEVLR